MAGDGSDDVPCGCAALLAMASLALLFRRRSLCPASRRRQLRFASSNSEIAWNLRVRYVSENQSCYTTMCIGV